MLLNKLLLLFTFMFSSNLCANETWKLASTKWHPYADASMENQGHSIQKLRESLAKEGIDLVIEFYPWNRAKKLVELNDTYLGVYPAWPEDVFEGAITSPPIDWSNISIMKHSDSTVAFESMDELFKKYVVGIVGTYVYPKEITDAMEKYPHHVERASSELSLLKKLAAGRGVVALTDPKVMLHLAQKEGIDKIEIIGHVMKKELVVALKDNEENKKRMKLLIKLFGEPTNK